MVERILVQPVSFQDSQPEVVMERISSRCIEWVVEVELEGIVKVFRFREIDNCIVFPKRLDVVVLRVGEIADIASRNVSYPQKGNQLPMYSLLRDCKHHRNET